MNQYEQGQIVCWVTIIGEHRVGDYIGPVQSSCRGRAYAVRADNGVVHVDYASFVPSSRLAIDRHEMMPAAVDRPVSPARNVRSVIG